MHGHMKLVYLLLFAIVGSVQQHVGADLAAERHNVPPVEKSVDIEYPTSQDSALMLSPCRPEKDGYFGGTSGRAALVQYAFAMESSLNADISEALDTIREYVMDITVATTFPAVCSYRDLSSSSSSVVASGSNMKGVTGFQFGQDFDAIQSCVPKVLAVGDCSIFTGTLKVYGNQLDVSLAEEILGTLLQQLAVVQSKLVRYGATRLEASKAYSNVSLQTPAQDKIDLMSAWTKMGLVLCILTIVTGITILVRFIRMEQRRHLHESGWSKNMVVKTSAQRWNISRLYRQSHDCDVTLASSVYSDDTSSARSKYRQRSRRPPATVCNTHVNRSQPVLSVRYYEPDSIYIVEPDDVDDDDGNLSVGAFGGEYGLDPLASVGLETF